ncbi:DIP1984 family protein [Rhodococcus sp. HM1]|uniref:DIP1984 family protein n=1 Tax=Rhodococcus sp. HM1 TaxID=2937759 RepID=UPI00200AC19B|nr:DIP1984 family protein [Rhodococcus sp. HM1]MCK8671952.1 DIP1984 family protein [Rhodococcus sp. HM1]
MKLAEALAARGDLLRRINQLRERILDNARHQEGEEPAEDPVALLAEPTDALDEYEQLIRRINRTNAASPLGDGTVTDAPARRDVLRLHHSAVNSGTSVRGGSATNRTTHAQHHAHETVHHARFTTTC